MPLEATYALRDTARLQETVKQAVADDHHLVILSGGDGSVSFVVDLWSAARWFLGLLPLGTANDFAGTLRLPTDLERACETGAQGEVVDVDFGLSGENYYANVAFVGLGAEVNQSLYSPECVEVEFSEVRAHGRAIYDVLGVAISIVGEERSRGVNEIYLEAGRQGKNTWLRYLLGVVFILVM